MIIGKCPVCGNDMRIGSDMTNAEHIRNMDDEDMALWIAHISDCTLDSCAARIIGCAENEMTCACAWHEWLKKEYET